MNDEIKIEKGIPVRKKGERGIFFKALEKMEIGDSFFSSEESRQRVHYAASLLSRKILTRKEGKGFRVWRTA